MCERRRIANEWYCPKCKTRWDVDDPEPPDCQDERPVQPRRRVQIREDAETKFAGMYGYVTAEAGCALAVLLLPTIEQSDPPPMLFLKGEVQDAPRPTSG